MSKAALILALVALLLVGGCGEGATSSGNQQAQLEARAEHRGAAAHRAKMRQQARAAARRHRRLVAARRYRAEVRAEEAARRAEAAAREEAATEEESSECDPNYAGACLDPSAYDYDCEGGSGDGPEYTGTVTVVGEDHYGLDADADDTGCDLP